MSFISQSFGSQPLFAPSASQLEQEVRAREEYEKEQEQARIALVQEAGKQKQLLVAEMQKAVGERKFTERDFDVVDKIARSTTTTITSEGSQREELTFVAKVLEFMAQADDPAGLDLLAKVISTITKKSPPHTQSTLDMTGKYFHLLALADAETANEDAFAVSRHDVFSKRT